MKNQPGLRERKAAQLKIRLAQALHTRLKTRLFREISVEELCEDAMISRMTFFNHFSGKDTLVDFMTAAQYYRHLIHIAQEGVTGLAAIRSLFLRMGEDLNTGMSTMFLHYQLMAERKQNRFNIEFSLAEKHAIAPDWDHEHQPILLSIGHFFRTHVEAARAAAEIPPHLDTDAVINLLGSVLHGGLAMGFRLYPDNPGRIFEDNFNTLILLLQPVPKHL